MGAVDQTLRQPDKPHPSAASRLFPSPEEEGLKETPMFEKLTNPGDRLAADAVAQTITRLANTPTPIGVAAEAIEGGVSLTGKGLRRRMIDNPQLRNFGK